MKVFKPAALTGPGLLMLVSVATAQAQSTPGAAPTSAEPKWEVEEVVVTARRRDERLLDVPLTVNAVTAEDLAKLNIRQFEDIETVVPGLTLNYSLGGTGASASVRGVAFDAAASGYNGTVEFYMNDSPITAEMLFPAMYDVGQVEVLRGPQGTLRGRASPSGSITLTTRRPDLSEFGGYVSATGTDIGGLNGNGALNVPIVDGKLAIRLAASYDENEFNQVESVNNTADPYRRVESGRASIRFEPTDSLSFDAVYQNSVQKIRSFAQYESANLADPTLAPSAIFIQSSDRLGLSELPLMQRVEYDNINFRAQWAFAGQRLNYSGAYNERELEEQSPLDPVNFFDATFPAFVQNVSGNLLSLGTQKSHELRLSSEERVFGSLDYIIGAFQQKTDTPTDVQRITPILLPPPIPGNPGFLNRTAIRREGETQERSAFANLTWHLSDSVEISGGVRYIEFESNASLAINGTLLAAATEDYKDDTLIYMGSAKYNISENFMVYASTGTSWRPGISVVGDFNLARTPLENSFLILPPEESESYEIGFKSAALDNRLQTSFSIFHQEFDNYPYRSASGVFFRELAASSTPPFTPFLRVNSFNFVAPVPVEVNGAEVQVSFSATDRWDIGASASYAKSEIQDGVIPCNDYFPTDGVPDTGSGVPTLGQIAATGDNLATCNVDYRASFAPLWSGAVQSEFRVPLSQALDTYVRGLVSFYGDSQNDPANAVDDVDSYALLNLYLGLRDRDGAWEVALYGKNVTDTERVLSRGSAPATVSCNRLATSITGVSSYRSVSFTEPREFGLNVRYAFGSR
jgi:iron complex outermembrane recepter protein